MRILPWLLPLCAALAGCNLAVSDHPMFSAGEQLATPLKSGLWVADDPIAYSIRPSPDRHGPNAPSGWSFAITASPRFRATKRQSGQWQS